MMRVSGKFLAACAALGVIGGCGQQQAATPSASPADYEKTLRMQLETAKSGDVITIPEGTFPMTRSLVLSASGVTIKGAGMDKSVLSFKGQIAGAEGLLVNASNFTIEDVAIEDTKGDALKVNEGSNIVIRRVRTEWTGGPSTQNGAYGIYPVMTQNTLVEGSVAIGASDAGIYVGQSQNVVIRNSRAEFNVAGIEIENTIGADVHDNVATNNTGGILVFNMPDLKQPGHNTRLFNNQVVGNNTKNFGAEGSAVASVPGGLGGGGQLERQRRDLRQHHRRQQHRERADLELLQRDVFRRTQARRDVRPVSRRHFHLRQHVLQRRRRARSSGAAGAA